MAGSATRKSRTAGVFAAAPARGQQIEPLVGKWGWFLALGIVLLAAGTLAIALPAVSTFAASVVLGIVLALAGVVKMVQSLQIKDWSGFVWQELTGAVEVVGGILIYFNPLKGAMAITLLIALVFLLQGILQVALALRIRDQAGWRWLAISGVVALGAGAALMLKVPYTRSFTPGTVEPRSSELIGRTREPRRWRGLRLRTQTLSIPIWACSAASWQSPGAACN